jgi:hypothetical protein
MAELNLNFHKNTDRYNPTEDEIIQIESVAISIEAIIKTLAEYARGSRDDAKDTRCVCLYVCNALELLMAPVIDYLSEYAGDVPARKKQKGKQHEEKSHGSGYGTGF